MIHSLELINWMLDPDHPKQIQDVEVALSELRSLNLYDLYVKLDLPFLEVLKYLNNQGITFDKKECFFLSKELEGELLILTQKIHKEVGEDFNINSPKQLSVILFDKLNLDNSKNKKKSTSIEFLEDLQDSHIIIPYLIKYRELFKLKSTYIDNFLEYNSERIYTHFYSTHSATGRLSSEDPNLQNIPDSAKRVFISKSNFSLVSFDYSQIELRIVADITDDDLMQNSFSNKLDIHVETASVIWGLKKEDVTKELRNISKALNFGVLYGMGSRALSKVAKIPIKEADRFISIYKEKHPKIIDYQNNLIKEAFLNGYVENRNLRKRFTPNITSGNTFFQKESERVVINMPIQSLGADIIKSSMLDFYKLYKDNEDIRLILSIHDELLFEIKDDKIDFYKDIIIDIMRRNANLKIPVEINYKKGKRWSDLG